MQRLPAPAAFLLFILPFWQTSPECLLAGNESAAIEDRFGSVGDVNRSLEFSAGNLMVLC